MIKHESYTQHELRKSMTSKQQKNVINLRAENYIIPLYTIGFSDRGILFVLLITKDMLLQNSIPVIICI